MPRQPIAIGLIFLMVWSGIASTGCGRSSAPSVSAQTASAQPVSASAAASPTAPPVSDRASAAAVGEASQRLAAAAPRSAFDVDRKAAELGPDVARVFAFVRDEVRGEVYAGVLRGARGSLIAHAGNAWDKSVLLAALLRHHGREVRFARGRLASDRAAALVTKMFDEANRPPPAAAIALPDAVTGQGRALLASIETRSRAAQADLTAALDRAGVTLGRTAPVPDAVLVGEASDHAWVEYRDGDRWIALDPAAAAQPGETAATAAETFAQIPDALQHRVTFHVKVEERRNGALAEHDAFISPTTAAALHGASVLLAHRIGRTPLGRWLATPVLFVDDHALAALSFTDAGLDVPASAKDALVGEASKQVQGVGAISGLFGAPATPASSTPAAGGELTAVRLDVEFTDPSGHSETVRRTILDRLGSAARAQKTEATTALSPLTVTSGVPLDLAAMYGCAITSGPLDPRLIAAHVAPSTAVMDDSLALAKLAQTPGERLPADAQARLKRIASALPAVLASTAQTVHLLSHTLAARAQPTGGALLWYEATPRMVIVGLDPMGSVLSVDLRRNALRVVARDVSPEAVVRANLSRGVVDGTIEDALTRPASDVPRASSLSTLTVLDRAREQNIRIVATKRAVDGAQRIVVAPERAPSVNATPRLAWWQVDAATGETIGVLDSGLHGAQAVPEYGARAQAVSPFAKTIGAAADAEQGYATGFAAGEASGYGAGFQWGVMAGVLIGSVMAVLAFIIVVLTAKHFGK